MIDIAKPFPACERVTGVVGDYTYVARSTGAWQLFPRGRIGDAVAGGLESTIEAAQAAARKRAIKQAIEDAK
jgi:hypothetical protein